jgi:hypothetical protein
VFLYEDRHVAEKGPSAPLHTADVLASNFAEINTPKILVFAGEHKNVFAWSSNNFQQTFP